MEALSGSGGDTRGSTDADPAIAREMSGRLGSSDGSTTAKPDSDKTGKESATERRKAADGTQIRRVKIERAREVLGKHGIRSYRR